MARYALKVPAASLNDEEGDELRLRASRELASIYTDVMGQPVPAELRLLIEVLEERYRAKAFPSHRKSGQQPRPDINDDER